MQPLDGIRVVDLTQIYNGSYAAFLMAMSGAEVVKVEPRDGERLRHGAGADTPFAFAMLNSNKKCVTLDLKAERGKEILQGLVVEADILLENYAPGIMDKLGVGWEVLRKVNPRLIYGSSTGYGLSGPDRDQLAMDHTIQATSGVMGQTGEPGQRPVRAGGAPCDFMGGVHLFGGVMAALEGRHKTGKGTRVEVSMLEAMYYTLGSEFGYYHRYGKLPERRGVKSASSTTPYSIYPCSDGYVAVICVSQQHWLNILDLIGRADLKTNPAYKDRESRSAHEPEINEIISAWTQTHARDDAYMLMRKARIPVAPVRDLEEVRTDAHLHARKMLEWKDHPEMGRIVLNNSPIRFSDYDYSDIEFFHPLGADNEAVYADWLSLTDDEIATLKKDDVI